MSARTDNNGDEINPASEESRTLPYKVLCAIQPNLFIGLGLRWVWIYAIFYSTFSSLLLSNPVFTYSQYPSGIISIIFFIAITLGMGAFSDRITFFITRRRFQVIVALILAASTACLFLSNEFFPIPLIVFADSFNGMASGFLMLIWSEGFRRREPLVILTNSVLSVMLGFIIFRFIIFALPPLVGSALFAIMPLFEIMFLYLTLHGSKAFTQPQQFTVTSRGTKVAAPGLLEIPTFHRLSVQRGKFFLRIGIPFLFFGLALKLLCDLVFRSEIEPSFLGAPWPDFLISTLLPCGIMLILALVFIATNQSDECEQYYRYIIPIASILILVASFQESGHLGTVFTSTSYLCLEFMLWMELCVVSHRYRISPILVAGFGRGALVLGMLVMSLVIFVFFRTQGLIDYGIVYTFSIVMLVVGYSLLPREKDIKSMAVLDLEKDYEGSLEEGGSVSEMAGAKMSASATHTKRFVARCERIANTFLLSPRELDVFFLLAKGRNGAYIAKHLYISEGTVNKHMWRIYRKLDVHSQQELMDMVEEPLTEKKRAQMS